MLLQQRRRVAAGVAHDALWLAGRPGGVKDVERVGGQDRDRVVRRGCRHCLGEILIPAGHEVGPQHRPLQDQATLRLVRAERDGFVEERLVGDEPPWLDAARRADHGARPCVLDALGKFRGGEAPEHDGVDGAYPRAGEHRHRRLGHHGHVDHHAVAFTHAQPGEGAREPRHMVAQLGIREPRLLPSRRTVPDQRRLAAAPGVHVPVERVAAHVEPAAREPLAKRAQGGVEDAVPALIPLQRRRDIGPPTLGIAPPSRIGRLVARAHHTSFPCSRANLARSVPSRQHGGA